MKIFNTDVDILSCARDTILGESKTLREMCDHLDGRFVAAVMEIHRTEGHIVLIGAGKSGDIARKITGTFNSTGTRAIYLDCTRAAHGDLGLLDKEDTAILFSNSGETEEITRLLKPIKNMGIKIIAVTSKYDSTMAVESDIILWLGDIKEVCPLGLAPSSSAVAMLAMGDALAFAVAKLRGLSKEEFAIRHPAGSLGRKLTTVDDVMRCGRFLRIAGKSSTVREVYVRTKAGSRKSGAVVLVSDDGKLAGIFTDGDLARLLGSRNDRALDRPIREIMTSAPYVVNSGAPLDEAINIMREKRVCEIPVIDAASRPVGMVDAVDIIPLLSEQEYRRIF